MHGTHPRGRGVCLQEDLKMKRAARLLTVATLSLALSACTNMDGTPNRTRSGAVVGGLTGAALGGAIGHNPDTALVGGVLGAGVGAMIGQNMDVQAGELKQSLQGTGAKVVRNGKHLTLVLPENVTFQTGSSAVHSGFRTALAEVSRSLKKHRHTIVQVIGYTDNVGSAVINQQLSVDRARAVSQILVATGTPNDRLTFSGMGMSNPVASNRTAAGRAANRRVEIIITPTK